ncbi:MAG: MlaE family ABC transporter permease [Alphaproteobacteria bacterium]
MATAEAQAGWLEAETDGDRLLLKACGAWTVAVAAALDLALEALPAGRTSHATIDLSRLNALDTAGAWLIHRTMTRLQAGGLSIVIHGADPSHEPLLHLVADADRPTGPAVGRDNPFLSVLLRLGKGVIDAGTEAKSLVSFFGLTVITFFHCMARPRRFRITALVNQIERTGLDAVPIVGLLSFLIGVVLAYQGADQLRRFGAEIFTVNLLAVSVLREIGVLMTAIMLAGRSGSAFTAQIGTMQVNEEVAAMRTLGLDPVEVLVLPRINGLLITLPLLTFVADIMGVLGGAIMAVTALDLSIVQFIRQFKEAAEFKHFLVGMVKAPVFAYIIALVGCFEGLRVSGSAESVGQMTTKAVVEAIFLVILADAVFSILFSIMGV